MSVFVLLAGLAIYAAVRQGVQAIDLKGGTITFANLNAADIEGKQPQVVSEVAAAEQRAQAEQQSPASAVPDIYGQWMSDIGLTYLIQQYGERFVVQEVTPYGVTAYGEGTITGQQAQFRFWAITGATGIGQFTITDAATMLARFDNSQGMSTQTTLTR